MQNENSRVDMTFYGFNTDRKIHAIKFMRALLKLINEPAGLREAKTVVDAWQETGNRICVTVNSNEQAIIRALAVECGIEIDEPTSYVTYLN